MRPQESYFETISVEGIYKPASYHHAIRAGHTIYVAGQVARDVKGALVAPNDAAGQARQVYANLHAVLRAAGADWHNVVKITTYLVDPEDSAVVTAQRRECFGEVSPPHTGLIVASLGSPEVRLEVEVIAVLDLPSEES